MYVSTRHLRLAGEVQLPLACRSLCLGWWLVRDDMATSTGLVMMIYALQESYKIMSNYLVIAQAQVASKLLFLPHLHHTSVCMSATIDTKHSRNLMWQFHLAPGVHYMSYRIPCFLQCQSCMFLIQWTRK